MAFPTTGILDVFTGSDESPVSTNWSSIIWTSGSDFNGLQRVSNALTVLFTGDNASSWYDVQTFGPDCEAYVTYVDGSENDDVRVAVRLVNPGTAAVTGYEVRFQRFDDIFVMYRWDDEDSPWHLGQVAGTFAPGDKIGVSAVGSTIQCWHYTGGAWAMEFERTDATYANAGYMGLRAAAGGATLPVLDDFGGGTQVTDHAFMPSGALSAIGF